MKKILSILAIILACAYVSAQDIAGDWNGVLKVQDVQLRVVFHVTKTADGYSSTMDSPDQGASGFPVTTTTYENSTLTLIIKDLGVEYTGTFKEGSVTGTFKQSGLTIPLVLNRGTQ